MRETRVLFAPVIGVDGSIPVPVGPGLGVEVNVDALQRFALAV